MKKVRISLSVDEAIENIKLFLTSKGFKVFADIDHQANARSVDLDMPGARVIFFGNPLAGTKLMQKDISMSFDLPLRLAVIEQASETFLLYQSKSDYSEKYQVEGHPVLEKVEDLFSAIISEVSEDKAS